jgi:hypothetical protein
VVVIRGYGHDDVREWGMGLGGVTGSSSLSGEGDGHVIVVVGG